MNRWLGPGSLGICKKKIETNKYHYVESRKQKMDA